MRSFRDVDYLADVGGAARIFAIVGLAVAFLVLGGIDSILVTLFIHGRVRPKDQRSLWSCVGLVGVLWLVSGWLLLRLVARRRSANGITLMPTWFIQLFGVVFAVALIFTSFW